MFNIFDALVCPIYLPRRKLRPYPQDSLIQTCDDQCLFEIATESSSACLGVYTNHSGDIWIKQLGVISSDEQCLTSKECLLDADLLNSQSFSCCCSSDNCTLKWRNLPRISSTTRTIFIKETGMIDVESNQNSWKFFLILFLFILILLLIIFTFTLWKSFHHEEPNSDQQSFLKPSLSPFIEQLFFSAQLINTSQNTIVYRTMMDNTSMVLKVYQSTNMSLWKNEITLLKSIEHDSIIKYTILTKEFHFIFLLFRILSDGQYNSSLYLLLPYYENGTLQSYLRTPDRTVSLHQCLMYFRSLASALSYLHLGQASIHTTIVHRDIKSSNILIGKNESHLCLADFGLALPLPSNLTEKDFVQIGTTRYMAPELLQGIIAHTREALCSVDMYALALVLWEIINQCNVYSTAGNNYSKMNERSIRCDLVAYRPPYDEYLPHISDGSYFASQLYDIVVVQQCRPSFQQELKNQAHAQVRPFLKQFLILF